MKSFGRLHLLSINRPWPGLEGEADEQVAEDRREWHGKKCAVAAGEIRRDFLENFRGKIDVLALDEPAKRLLVATAKNSRGGELPGQICRQAAFAGDDDE